MRLSLVCVLFDPAIPTSFFNFIQLFLYLFLFFFIVINFINATWFADGRCAKFFATPLINLRSYCDDEQDRTKKAALGGPSSDETFPLREKT